MEGTRMSINEWMDKQNMVYTENEILHRLKKKGKNWDICQNMDGPSGHYAKRNKPVTKRQTLYDSTSMIPLIFYLE